MMPDGTDRPNRTDPHRTDEGWANLRLRVQYYQWLIMSGLAVAAVILAYLGFQQQITATGETKSPLDMIYAALQLFVLDSSSVSEPVSWHLQTARFLAPGIAAYAALRALAAIFREQRQMLKLCFTRNHVIVCGLGKRGLYLARAFHRAGHTVTVIERDAENDHLSYCRSHGIITLIGDCTTEWQLRKARIGTAQYLIAVCGSDGTNAEVAVLAQGMAVRSDNRAPVCYAHVTDSELCRLLKERRIQGSQASGVGLEFFNVFQTGAAALLKAFPLRSLPSEAGGKRAHMVLVGMGQLGHNLAINAIRQWNTAHPKSAGRLFVTVVDRCADRLIKDLCARYRRISEYCRLVSCQMDVLDPEFRQGGFLSDPQGGPVTSVYVCLDNDSVGLSAGMALSERLQEIGARAPVVVRMAEGAGLAKLLPDEGAARDKFQGLHAFCLLDETCRPEMVIGGDREIIARAIHEDYVANEAAKGQTPETNPSMVPWEILPEHLRESNRQQADHLAERLRAYGYTIVSLTDWDAHTFEFTPEEIEGMARIEHERWCEEKRRAGFTYAPGPKTDTTHPDLVEYDKLDEEEKEKDRNMVHGLPRFLAKAGFQVKRIKEAHNST